MSHLAEHAKQVASFAMNRAFDLPSSTWEDRVLILKGLIEIRDERIDERYQNLIDEHPERKDDLDQEVGHLLQEITKE